MNDNTQEVKNPIAHLISVKEEIRRLENIKKQAEKQLHAIMDANKTDVLVIGDNSAKRALIVQSRLDTNMVKELLGDNAPMKEVEQIRITLI